MTLIDAVGHRHDTTAGRFAPRHPSASSRPLLGGRFDALGTWDEKHHAFLIAVTTFGLTIGGTADLVDAAVVMEAWKSGRTLLPAPVDVPVDQIVGAVQRAIRSDVLEWYSQRGRCSEETWENQESFYGADGPLAAESRDGRILVLDGCHRFVAAKIRGDATFSIQVLPYPAGF